MDAIACAEERTPASMEGSELSVAGLPARSTGIFFAAHRSLPPFSRVVPLAGAGALPLGPAIADAQGTASLELGITELDGSALSVRFLFRDEAGIVRTSGALGL